MAPALASDESLMQTTSHSRSVYKREVTRPEQEQEAQEVTPLTFL